MIHRGSCHCGKVKFEAEGDLQQVIECNCSHCARKGFLLWFIPRGQLRVISGEDALVTYLFNKRVIQHRFCAVCGVQPFGFGQDKSGAPTAAVNARCLDGVDLSAVKVVPVDGRNY